MCIVCSKASSHKIQTLIKTTHHLNERGCSRSLLLPQLLACQLLLAGGLGSVLRREGALLLEADDQAAFFAHALYLLYRQMMWEQDDMLPEIYCTAFSPINLPNYYLVR